MSHCSLVESSDLSSESRQLSAHTRAKVRINPVRVDKSRAVLALDARGLLCQPAGLRFLHLSSLGRCPGCLQLSTPLLLGKTEGLSGASCLLLNLSAHRCCTCSRDRSVDGRRERGNISRTCFNPASGAVKSPLLPGPRLASWLCAGFANGTCKVLVEGTDRLVKSSSSSARLW
uniref:Uncharacterized protein n=1 Tax=Emiliania huxleyi TaxID=2903 RepID=A0A7S3SUS3_EMIHU